MRMKLELTSCRQSEHDDILSECSQIVESFKLFAYNVEWMFVPASGDGFYTVDCELDSTPEAWQVLRDTLEVFEGWSLNVEVKNPKGLKSKE